jgi:hypothetical protein
MIVLLSLAACTAQSERAGGWRALDAGMDLTLEHKAGPQGQAALGLFYSITSGQICALEQQIASEGLVGLPPLRFWAKAARVLHLAIVLADDSGVEHECALTLAPGGWRELLCAEFLPPVSDWGAVRTMRVEDRTGMLGGQGPVSLKLAGLPLDE